MPCDRFEDLLTGFSELSAEEREPADAHLAACADCREYLETLAALDRNLTTLYRGVQPTRPFNPASVLEPSALPEILDFCGWAAVLAIVVVLAVTVASKLGVVIALPVNAGWYAAGAAMIAVLVGQALGRRLPEAGRPLRPPQ